MKMGSTLRYAAFLLLAMGPYRIMCIGEDLLNSKTLLGLLGGFSHMFQKFERHEIDVDKALGRWHQVYKAAVNFDQFQSNMYCHVAYIQRNKVMGAGGMSIVEAFRVNSREGAVKTYKRDLSRTGPGEYWMFTEDYFYPRQFFIFDVGPVINGSYEYLVATDANRISLTIFARDPVMFYKLYDQQVQEKLAKGGFGGYSFWNRPENVYQGFDCAYPDEKEIFIRRALPITDVQPQSQILPFLRQASQLLSSSA
ncbi:hypothetical protein M514_06115 [Trichuris suis]|uniref:Lipocalin domain-containing protein n=1 Tax=Trichuris suis TaxID=68888 RepID=A0A085M703_9BILA|nr:hypothetical protein M513_06115 [Trichuris suis]KFD69870.1 hypothetical protein M514_06115 [Trichuris suis]